MTYKGMILSALLVPFTIIGNDTDPRIQQLKNDLHAKELELSELENMIAEKEKQIDAIRERGGNLYYSICHDLDDQEKQYLEQEINHFKSSIEHALSIKSDITAYFAKRFRDGHNNFNELERLKFVLIRYAIEYTSLKQLFKRYEDCLLQILALKIALEDLQQ